MVFLVYAYVPITLTANTATKVTATAVENSSIIVGSETVVLVGIHIACKAQVLEVRFSASVLVV